MGKIASSEEYRAEPIMEQLLDPKNDIVFKMLFTQSQNARLLHSLLTAVLAPPEPIVEVEVLNPELPKLIVGDRNIILDIHARLANGDHANIEMQMAHNRNIWARMHYHWARLFSQEIKAGHDYSQLRPATVIFFTNFCEFQVSPDEFHLSFRAKELKGRTLINDFFKLEVIQLPQVFGLPLDSERSDNSLMLLQWSRFLCDPNKDLWKGQLMTHPIIKEAEEALKKLSEDPQARELARARDMWAFDMATMKKEAREEGREEGREKGREEGREKGREEGLKQSARLMRKSGMELVQIAKILEVPESQLAVWMRE